MVFFVLFLCFLKNVSLKVTAPPSHFDHVGLGVAILAVPLEKASLVCHSILEISIVWIASCW